MNFQKGNARCRRIDLLLFFVMTQSVADMTAELCRGSCCCRSGCSLAIYRPWQALPSPFRRVARWFIQHTLALDSVFAIVFGCFSRIKKLLGWTETQMSVDTNSLRHILRQWVNDLNYPARSRSRHRAKNSIPWSQHSVRFTNIREHCASRPWALRNCQNPWDSRVIRETWHVWWACVSVCTPPSFFSTRPDCNQNWHAFADWSGNHSNPKQFDPPHPTPGGVSGGSFRSPHFKTSWNFMNCWENRFIL